MEAEGDSAMSDTHDQPAPQPRGGAAGGTTAAGPADTARPYVPRPAPGYDDVSARDRGPSGLALGGTMLAAVLLMLTGLFGFFEGLAAIIRGSFFVVLPNYAFSMSAVGWGWVHLILGVLSFAAGAALFLDKLWARIVGVVLAAFSAVANFVFLPYYTGWAIVIIALDAFIIWALLTSRNR
jgi:hypothetical protein